MPITTLCSGLGCTALGILALAALQTSCAIPIGATAGQDPTGLDSAQHRRQARERARAGRRWTGQVHAQIGGRDLDSSWGRNDNPFAFGVEGVLRPADAWIGVESGLTASFDRTRTTEAGGVRRREDAALTEFYIGPRLMADLGAVQPYVGGGISALYADVERTSGFFIAEDDDSTIGGYVHGGLLFPVHDHVHFGIDVRATWGGDLDLFASDRDPDYLQVAAVIGGSW